VAAPQQHPTADRRHRTTHRANNLIAGADHGALIELGLDDTTFNFTDTSMGVYARSGVVLWGGDRGTSWQVQGGLNFRF
jgi:hypothetical protein